MPKKSKGWSISPTKMVKEEVEKELTRKVRVLAFTALDQIIHRMPVLSGRARGSVIASIGEPDYSVPDGVQPPPTTINIPNTPYTTVYLQSNLIYMPVIEYGSENRPPENVFSSTFRDIQNL